MTIRDELLRLLKERAVSFGRFTLASGKESTYYIDSKKVLFNGEAAWLIGKLLCRAIAHCDIQAIGGPEIGAIPMATAAAIFSYGLGHHIEAFCVRKQAKGHGSQERIEGVVKPGWRVAVVDDVLTTGGSVEQAIAEVEKAGAQVVAVCCLVDRLEGARERLEPRYPFLPLYTIRDLGIEPDNQ